MEKVTIQFASQKKLQQFLQAIGSTRHKVLKGGKAARGIFTEAELQLATRGLKAKEP